MSEHADADDQARKYCDIIISYAQRSYKDTLHSGENYLRIAEFMEKGEEHSTPSGESEFPLAYLHTFQDGKHNHSSYMASELHKCIENVTVVQHHSQVIFLCGYLPASWIASVGAKYNLNPRFFQRHLPRWPGKGAPCLPSATAGLALTLRIYTLVERRLYIGAPHMDSRGFPRRKTGFVTHGLDEWVPGHSILRGYSKLDRDTFALEQDISVCVQFYGQRWAIVVWSDVGGHLQKSPDFEFLPSSAKDIFRPKPVHQHVSPAAVLELTAVETHTVPEDSRPLIQSAFHLPREFATFLDPEIAAQDPLYAILPILSFGAASELQLLDRLEADYDSVVLELGHDEDFRRVKDYHTVAVPSLMQCKVILDDHGRRLQEVLRFFRSKPLTIWMKSLNEDQHKEANKRKQAVQEDYEYLLSLCRDLSQKCQEAISVLMSSASIAESKKQIDLAVQVNRLTILATIFLPLSFCASVFGMNFVELEDLRIWIWAVVTAVVGMATFILYQWDVRGPWRRLCLYIRQRRGIDFTAGIP